MLGYGYYYDPTYILVLIGALLSLWASAKVKSTYSRYAKVYSRSGLTGAEAAQQILKNAGIYGVRVEHISGNLTDHYDPKAKVLRLSDSVYGSRSVAAVGVAAHECGHAIQDDVDYVPLRFRSAFVPVANIGTQIAWPILLVGLLFARSYLLIQIGLLCFFFGVLFQLITPSGRVQCICESRADSGRNRYAGSGRIKGHQKGIVCGSHDLCGGSCSLHSVHAASYSSFWR